MNAEVLKEIQQTDSEPIEPIRSELSNLIKKQVASKYKDCSVLVLSLIKGLSYILDITISANSYNNKNKWSGEWISTYQFAWCKDEKTGKFSGEILIKGHYYEEGSIQRKVNRKHASEDISIDSNAATQICNLIAAEDTKVREVIQSMEGEFSEALLKKIRRKLPVTGQKYSWDSKLPVS